MSNPYVKPDSYGRNEMDLESFGRDLAAALNLPVNVDNPGSSYPVIDIDCGDGLVISMRAEYGAKVGKVELFAHMRAAGKLEHHERPKMPSAGVDASRDMVTLARDVTRRIIEPAQVAAAATREAIAAREEKCGGLAAMATALMAEYPGMSIRQRDPNATSAEVYFNKYGVYLTGSLRVDGKIEIQRLSLATVEQSRALLALITGKA